MSGTGGAVAEARIEAALVETRRAKHRISEAMRTNLQSQAALRDDMRELCTQAGECDDLIDALLDAMLLSTL